MNPNQPSMRPQQQRPSNQAFAQKFNQLRQQPNFQQRIQQVRANPQKFQGQVGALQRMQSMKQTVE